MVDLVKYRVFLSALNAQFKLHFSNIFIDYRMRDLKMNRGVQYQMIMRLARELIYQTQEILIA